MDLVALRKLREDMNLQQKTVAKKIGISRSMYSLIENGKRNPSLKIMNKFVKFFGEEAKDVFFEKQSA